MNACRKAAATAYCVKRASLEINWAPAAVSPIKEGISVINIFLDPQSFSIKCTVLIITDEWGCTRFYPGASTFHLETQSG